MNQTIKADLTEILFAHRERNYGAYVLRKRYPKVLLLATLLTVLGALSIPASHLLASKLGWLEKPVWDLPKEKPEQIAPPNILPLIKKLPPPLSLPKLSPPRVKVFSSHIPEPEPETELTETQTIHEQETLREAPIIGLSDQDGEENIEFIDEGSGDELGIPEVIQESGQPDPYAIINPDEHPRALNMKEISQAIGYPHSAQTIGLEGQVVIRVLIDEKGAYLQHIVLNGVHPILEKAVEAQLPNLKFTPAIQGKKPIKFWVNIPFSFKLIK